MRLGNLITTLRWRGGLTAPSNDGHVRSVGDVALVGTALDSYELVELIGAGGFGSVYRARHTKIETEVAIKVLHSDRCSDPSSVARFIDEARAVNTLRHPKIVDVFDFGTTASGGHYFVMELLRGRSLAQILEERRLGEAEALPLLRQLAEVVDAIHAAGATHRDLKPANLMVLEDGRVKLIDFGLAKLSTDVDRTHTREALGSPLYMAPEQCRGLPADARSDRYSFGVLAYHTLVGAPPFSGDALVVAVSHVEKTVKRPALRRELSDGLLALLAKDPAARPTRLVSVIDQMSRRNWRRPLGIALATLFVVGASTVATIELTRPSPPAKPIDPTHLKAVREMPIAPLNFPSLRRDGAAIDFRTQAGMATVPWSGPATTSNDLAWYRTRFPDGSSVSSHSDRLELDASNGEAIRSLGIGEWGEACENGTIAMVTRDHLYVIQPDDEARDLGLAPGAWGVSWSPACDAIAWGNWSGAYITDLRLHATTKLPIETALPGRWNHPVAFLDRSTVTYCGRDATGMLEVRAHYLDQRAPDTILATFDRDFSACIPLASRDGKRIAVQLESGTTTFEIANVSKPSEPIATLFTDSHHVTAIMGFPDDDHVLLEAHEVRNSIDYPLEESATRTTGVEEYAVDGTHHPATYCHGAISTTHYGDRFSDVILSDGGREYRFVDPKRCSSAIHVPLPVRGLWGLPACEGDTCLSAIADGSQLAVYQLMPTTKLLLHVPVGAQLRDTSPLPVVAVSPDGKHAVALRKLDTLYSVIDLTTNTATTYRLGSGIDPSRGAPRWIDNDHFLLDDNTEGGSTKVDLLGHEESFVRDRASSLLSPSRTRIVVLTSTGTTKLVMMELQP